MNEQTKDNNPQIPADSVKKQGTMESRPVNEPQKSATPGAATPGAEHSGEKKRPFKRYYRRNSGNKRFYPRKQGQYHTTPGLSINNKVISVVVPLYNEEDSVVELSIALKKVLESIKANYEVIFIDDGSTDSSFLKIKEINHLNNRFKCIKFKRNYGKSAALSEGFKTANGDFVITMDADLQDDPEEIPALITKLNEGYDLVSGWKKKRRDPFVKKQTSKLFNLVTSRLVGLRLHDYNCGLKAYRKDVIKNIRVYGEMHRYIPALAFLSGYKVTEISVTHHPRKFGATKFGTSRFINGLLDLITVLFTTRFIKRPLHLFGTMGLISFAAGLGIIAYLTILKFFDSIPISNRPLFLVGILMAIVGAQFISLGLIAEMITKNSADIDNIIIEKTL